MTRRTERRTDMYMNTSTRAGLGARTSIALGVLLAEYGVRLDPSDLADLAETVVSRVEEKGEGPWVVACHPDLGDYPTALAAARAEAEYVTSTVSP